MSEAGDPTPSPGRDCAVAPTPVVHFGEFRFDPQRDLLYRGGQTCMTPPRVLAVLKVLLERPRRVVSRDAILQHVWAGAHVADSSLSEAVKELRRILGDDPANPRYIQTIPRRGYRLVAAVTLERPQEIASEHPREVDVADPARTGVHPAWRAASLALLAIVLVLAWLLWWRG